MVAAAWQGADDADLIGVLYDAARRGIDDDTRAIVARLKEQGREAILILNKIDLVRRDVLLAQTEELNRDGAFTDTFMISAATGDGWRICAPTSPPGCRKDRGCSPTTRSPTCRCG